MKNIIHGIKNNQLLHFIVFFVAFCSISIFSMRMSERGKASAKRYLGIAQKEEAISKKRDLLIFLDDSEKNLGFVGSNLMAAIVPKAAPIIVSTSVLNNLTMINEQTRYYLANAVFQSNQWIIKKINNSLILLIPMNYLQVLNIDAGQVKTFDSSLAIDTVSDVELRLGLKVNHMETLEYQSMTFTTHLTKKFLGYFYTSSKAIELGLADYFINTLDAIFCKKLDYQNKKTNIPEWIMYIVGHGELLHSVADLSLEDFKKLLHFLDSKINTNLLVISSCYAAGMNANKIYGEIQRGTQEYYSFPIIIRALNDTVASIFNADIEIEGFWNPKINLKLYINFVDFFKKAKELEGNYGEIIKSITMWNFIQNTPQIKLPDMEWFSVIDTDKKIVSIGTTLVKTRDPQKPLDVVSFFKKDPEIILLYTDDIPFELVVNSSKMKAIVSMVLPQLIEEENETKEIDVYTRIKKISSSQSFCEILRWFKSVTFAKYSFKRFFID
ncbi:MAG TPA: hypothetical protein VKR58_07505, partial [Aquella sp.]|nr:hypothetical protein [Aquella sp.]